MNQQVRFDVDENNDYITLELNFSLSGALDTVKNDLDSGNRVITDYDADDNEVYSL